MSEDLLLLLREIKDQHTRENFFRIINYVGEKILLQGSFQLYEIEFTEARTNFKFPHHRDFVPQDVILLQLIGNRNLEFNHDEFDFTDMDITADGPCYVRFLAGRLPDDILGPEARQGLTNVPIGGGTTTVGPLATVTRVMDCAVAAAIDDWVFQSTTVDNFAVVASSSIPASSVIGVIKDKPTSTTCTVVLEGVHPFTLARGTIFLGAAGTAVLTAPTVGAVQILGTSFGNGDIHVSPELARLVYTP